MSKNKSTSASGFLEALSFDKFNEMQTEFIEKAASNPNLILLAPTGSGKTVAFLVPLISRLKLDHRGIQALIIVPSRELALQIEQVFKSLKTNFRVSTVYGGHSSRIEVKSLLEKPDVVIGTPGRLVDHLKRESFDMTSVHTLILDEFDKSLQLGFHDEMEVIFRLLKGEENLWFTSATTLSRLPSFIPFRECPTINYLKDSVDSKLQLSVVHFSRNGKEEMLVRLLSNLQEMPCIVFCNLRDSVDQVSQLFKKNGIDHSVMHGGLEQLDREKNLIRFRSKVTNVLVATDLASRGLDIPEIGLIVHFELPDKEDSFTHRNGRTARMQNEGKAFFLVPERTSLPDYLNDKVDEFVPDRDAAPYANSEWKLLYISAGKKDKVSKGDIVGVLIKKGGLNNEDLGLITLMDHASYVAVKGDRVTPLLGKLKNEKIKKIKIKIEEAN